MSKHDLARKSATARGKRRYPDTQDVVNNRRQFLKLFGGILLGTAAAGLTRLGVVSASPLVGPDDPAMPGGPTPAPKPEPVHVKGDVAIPDDPDFDPAGGDPGPEDPEPVPEKKPDPEDIPDCSQDPGFKVNGGLSPVRDPIKIEEIRPGGTAPVPKDPEPVPKDPEFELEGDVAIPDEPDFRVNGALSAPLD